MPESRPGKDTKLRVDRRASRGRPGCLGAAENRDERMPAVFHFGRQHPDDRGASRLEAKWPEQRKSDASPAG